MIPRFIWRELKNSYRFSLLFVLNLSIGLFGFVMLDAFKRSFQEVLYSASKQLLTADLRVSARRPITDEQKKTVLEILGEKTPSYESYTLYSMLSKPNESETKLVEVKAVEENFPFYGELRLKSGGTIQGESPKAIVGQNRAWLVPELLAQLKLDVGDSFQLGEQSFIVDDVIVEDTTMGWMGAALAPRIYVGLDQMPATGLVQPGSTIWRSIFYKLTPDQDSKSLQTEIFDELDNPAIRVTNHIQASQNNARMINYLSDYLGLVSLVAFFLSGVGAIYLFRSYLLSRYREIAILLSLGSTHRNAVLIYSIQIGILGLASALFSSILAAITLPIAAKLIGVFTPLSFAPAFSLESFIIAMLMGVVGSGLLCLPLIAHIRNVTPASLFQEQFQPKINSSMQSLILASPGVFGFYALSVWQAKSWLVGSLFFAILAISSVALGALAYGVFKLLGRSFKVSFSTRLAFRYLSHNKVHSITCFLALSVGSLLINLIPQIQDSLLSELETPEGLELPSLFLFDLQQYQKEEFESILAAQGVKVKNLSPTVAGRILSINGKTFDKGDNTDEESFSREEQRSRAMRNRGVNLTYRSELDDSEEITKGRNFSGPYDFEGDKIAEVSIEERYASRLNIDIGDKITFEVQGIPIETEVINLRKIKWNSFQPNFFIQLQPGVIDDAPATYLAALPPLSEEEKEKVQSAIVENFSNVSIIDVSQLVSKLASSIRQMSWILNLMAWISIFAGLIVLYSIASHQVRQRMWDVNLLKVLGGSFTQIRNILLKEFAILSFMAGFLGATFGLLVSYLLALALFDGLWRVNLVIPVLTIVFLVGLCVFVANLALRKVLNQKASFVLQTDH